MYGYDRNFYIEIVTCDFFIYRGYNGEGNEYSILTIQILLHVKMATLPQVLKKNAHIKKIVNFTLTVQKCFTLFSMHDQEYRILSGYGYCGFE